MKIPENARQTPVVGEFDVVVCGGGPAGVAAAVAAARSGARPLLLEQNHCLGGIWTAGAVTWIIDHENKPGIMREIIDGLDRFGARDRGSDGRLEATHDTGVRTAEIAPFLLGQGGDQRMEIKQRLRAAIEQGGVSPSYTAPVLFQVFEDVFALDLNHQYGVLGSNAEHLTAATIAGRSEVHRAVCGLRSLGAPWAKVKIVATSSHIGVREGRRIHGLYTVTAEDLRTGARHEDAVCRVTFCVDIHSTRREHGGACGSAGIRVKPYDVPLRALIARDVRGLMLAGRCISGDFFAHASYRVTGNAVAMGEAAGKVAARAAATDRLPHQVPWAEVREG